MIVSKEVIAKDLAGGTVGYIAVTGFSDNSQTKFHDALQADLKAGKKKIILDLRGDPGGYVTAARSIASEFIKDGPIFWEQRRRRQPDRDRRDRRRDRDRRSRSSSSSSSTRARHPRREIVAGALQDRKRATIVGETSFGKGTVQQWIQLQNGSALKLTIAKWLTPDKHWIHHVGIVPDVPVDDPGRREPDERPGARQGRRAADEVVARAGGRADAPRSPGPLGPLLARHRTFLYGGWERKEVMCSDRQYA